MKIWLKNNISVPLWNPNFCDNQFVLGGGSACLSLPIDEISPNEKMEFIKYLTRQGATIEELNSIRSQISKVKGGKLLEAARETNFIHTFILSGNGFKKLMTILDIGDRFSKNVTNIPESELRHYWQSH